MKALAILPVCALFAACSSLPPGPQSPAEVGRFTDEFSRLAERYRVTIQWDAGPLEEKHRWGTRSARNPADWELQAYTPILVEQLGLYPPSVIRKSGLKRIIICRDLWVLLSSLTLPWCIIAWGVLFRNWDD